MYKQWCLSLVFATLLAAAPVCAEDWSQPSASPAYTGISSSNPRTGGILPSSLFDPTRFSISNSLVFGASTGSSAYGGGTAGLFTSSLGYRLSPNMALSVAVGAHINPAFGSNDTAKGVFLESAAFNWKPIHGGLGIIRPAKLIPDHDRRWFDSRPQSGLLGGSN